jgi:hypothetical protein
MRPSALLVAVAAAASSAAAAQTPPTAPFAKVTFEDDKTGAA